MISGLLWRDINCEELEVFYFHNYADFLKAIHISIKVSMNYLRKHVWSKKIVNTKRRYGHHSRMYYFKYNKFDREAERVLRHSVEYFQKNLNYIRMMDEFKASRFYRTFDKDSVDLILSYL